MFYVYVYLDPNKPGEFKYALPEETILFASEPFYVGKGTKDRARKHLNEAKRAVRFNRKTNPKLDKIISILKTGKEPLIEIIAMFDEERAAFAFEETVIRRIGRRCASDNFGPLFNVDLGGYRKDVSGLRKPRERHTKISKTKISRSVKLAAKKYTTPEWRANISSTIKVAMSDPLVKRKSSAPHLRLFEITQLDGTTQTICNLNAYCRATGASKSVLTKAATSGTVTKSGLSIKRLSRTPTLEEQKFYIDTGSFELSKSGKGL